MKEIKALTSLRGIFGLWVLSYHTLALAPGALRDPFGLVHRGYLGVDFFFLLSGLVLARSYGTRFKDGFDGRYYARFLIRRAGRLFPLHLAVTAVCVLVAWIYGAPYSPWQVTSEALLIHRWGVFHAQFSAINGPAWSISTEWAANLLFPIFVAITLSCSTRFAALTMLLGFAVVSYLALAHGGSLDISLANTFSPLARCFAEFTLGMLVYRWREKRPERDKLAMVVGVAFVAAFLLAAPDILLVALFAVIVAVADIAGPAGRLFSIPPLHWLGELSYSIYLVHLPVLTAVRYLHLPPTAFALVGFAVTITLSIATYHLIERPGRDWSKSLSNNKRFNRVVAGHSD